MTIRKPKTWQRMSTRQSRQSLRHNNDIVKKPAYKVCYIVKMDKSEYIQEWAWELGHTHSCEDIQEDLTGEVIQSQSSRA